MTASGSDAGNTDRRDWSRAEVEAIVDDYLSMLSSDLAGTPYNKAAHRRALRARLANRIEHIALVRGDHAGYDILSFEADGSERLIEVKTTKYGFATPFFVSRNELSASERFADIYRVYRLFGFRRVPRMYALPGAISSTCSLVAANYLANPR